jgi:flagellar basal-body rod protein FlgB
MANADTPNFKAKDLNFQKAMDETLRSFDVDVSRTHNTHMSTSKNTALHTVYRTPLNAAADGNTVDMHYEQAEFGKEAMRYTATMQFLEGRVSSIRRALRGE